MTLDSIVTLDSATVVTLDSATGVLSATSTPLQIAGVGSGGTLGGVKVGTF